MKAQSKQRVIDFLQEQRINIDFEYHLKNADFETASDIQDILEDSEAFNVEIIYYSNAINYLQKQDNSLRRSLDIASELGYNIERLNSEVLASLLASKETKEEFQNIYSELDELIDEIQREEDEEDEKDSN
jgi:intracellular sulfur oxidation DsrE/DsrF family protein